MVSRALCSKDGLRPGDQTWRCSSGEKGVNSALPNQTWLENPLSTEVLMRKSSIHGGFSNAMFDQRMVV
jgi:hypothetical protein